MLSRRIWSARPRASARPSRRAARGRPKGVDGPSTAIEGGGWAIDHVRRRASGPGARGPAGPAPGGPAALSPGGSQLIRLPPRTAVQGNLDCGRTIRAGGQDPAGQAVAAAGGGAVRTAPGAGAAAAPCGRLRARARVADHAAGSAGERAGRHHAAGQRRPAAGARPVPRAAVGAPLWQGQPAAAGPDRIPAVGAVPDAPAAGPGAVLVADRVGGARPGLVGSARLRGRQLRPARRRDLGRHCQPAVRPGGRGRLRPDRMGRGAVVEHRRRRHARRVLPGPLTVEDRGAAAAEPEGDLSVGRLHGRLPGPDTSWRHPRGRLHQALEPWAARRPAAIQHRR